MINTNSEQGLPFGRDINRKGGYMSISVILVMFYFFWLRGEVEGYSFIILNKLYISYTFFPKYEIFLI